MNECSVSAVDDMPGFQCKVILKQLWLECLDPRDGFNLTHQVSLLQAWAEEIGAGGLPLKKRTVDIGTKVTRGIEGDQFLKCSVSNSYD